MQQLRPMVQDGRVSREPCGTCGARRGSVCSAVGDTQIARLAAIAVSRTFEKGRTFITEDEPATAFFNITRGTAKLFKLLPDGRQQVIGFAKAGHFLGLAASDTYAFSAEAIEPVRACRFSRSQLYDLLPDAPALERRLLQTACNELATAQGQILMLGRMTAQERVASFLLDWAGHCVPCGTADRLRLPMTRTDIADYLGLTIETVSRTFSRFKASGRIALPSTNEVVILDQGWLEAIAAGAARQSPNTGIRPSSSERFQPAGDPPMP